MNFFQMIISSLLHKCFAIPVSFNVPAPDVPVFLDQSADDVCRLLTPFERDHRVQLPVELQHRDVQLHLSGLSVKVEGVSRNVGGHGHAAGEGNLGSEGGHQGYGASLRK